MQGHSSFPSLLLVHSASNALEHLVDDDDGDAEEKDELPLVPAERADAEHVGERLDVENEKVQAKRENHCSDEPGVDPRGHDQQGVVFAERVERVHHFDGHENGEGERARLLFSFGPKVFAALDRLVSDLVRDAREGVVGKSSLAALAHLKGAELLERDRGVAVRR